MREVSVTNQYKKDVQRLKRQGKNLQKLKDTVLMLADDQVLPPGMRDHPLKGQWKDFRDCHIEPDWVLIYTKKPGILILVACGSHSELGIV